jgi:hypothetical protein
MTYIKSHIVVDTDLIAQYERDLNRIGLKIEQTKKNSANLSMLASSAEDAAISLVYLQPSSPEIKNLYQVYLESEYAIFKLACENKDIDVTIKGERFTLANRNVESLIYPQTWWALFFVAEFLGNEEVLQFLCNFPTQKLRDSSTKTEEYAYLYVDFLKAHWQRLPAKADLLIKVLHATDPKHTSFGAKHALHVIVPQIELFAKLYENNEAAFNAALEKALHEHKKYYSSSKDLKHRPQAFVSPGLVFVVRQAKKQGFKINVTSGYIPEILLQD